MPYIKSEYEDLDKYESYGGNIYYYRKGTNIKHNPYGPAVICQNLYLIYYVENKLHRLDGPAIIYDNGKGQYYINGKQLDKEEFKVHPERLKYLNKEHLICLI